MSITDRSVALGINIEHGIDFCEYDGNWPMPEASDGIIKILDNMNYPHVLVLDYTDGKFYDITTRDGPSGSNLFAVFKDKTELDGSGGFEISPEVRFKEDTGEYEKFITEHLSTRFYLRPNKESNRNLSGYNSNGYPSGIEFNSKIFVDGEPINEISTAEDVSKNGEIVYDRKAEGHRLQTIFSANKSDFRLVSRQQTYITKDVDYSPDTRITTEGNHQKNLSSQLLWMTRGETPSYDRVTGNLISGNFSYANGPDGKTNSAFNLNSSEITFPSISNTEQKTITFFSTSEPDVHIDNNNITLTPYSTENGWTMFYSSGIINSGNITISGTLNLFDVRLYNIDITDDLSYYYNDIMENGGNNVCPLY